MIKLIVALLLLPVVAFAAQAPDSLVVTGPNNAQVPVDNLLVTPPGGSQQTLGRALATPSGSANGMNVLPTGGAIQQTVPNAISANGTRLSSLNTTAIGDGVTNDQAPLQAMVNALPARGGTIVLENTGTGIYYLKDPIKLPSNSTLTCASGTKFLYDNTFSGTGFAGIVENKNYLATTITDHDITVIGCAVQGTTFSGSGNFKGFFFSAATRIHIYNPICDLIGDCTAMVGTQGTDVHDGYATNITNAAWDHWNAPQDFWVYGGYCQSPVTCFFATGTLGGSTPAPNVALRGGIIGGSMVMSNANTFATGAIILNGVGLTGSGAQHVEVSGVSIYYTTTITTQNQYCVVISGASQFNNISDVKCHNGRNLIQSDSGGSPSYNMWIGNSIDNAQAGVNGAFSVAQGSSNTFALNSVVKGTGSAGSSFNDSPGTNFFFNNIPDSAANISTLYSGVKYGSLTNPLSGSVTNAVNVISGGASVTVGSSSCGATTTPTSGSNNTAGSVSIPAGTTSCGIVFGSPAAGITPIIQLTPSAAGAGLWLSAVTTAGFTINQASLGSADLVTYTVTH